MKNYVINQYNVYSLKKNSRMHALQDNILNVLLVFLGVAIVTRERAGVWTERRFEKLAKQQIDCNWGIHILGKYNKLLPNY